MEYRIATSKEVAKQFNYLIDIHEGKEKEMWKLWKENSVEQIKRGSVIPYYGFIGDEAICEAYAVIDTKYYKLNGDIYLRLIDGSTAYLKAFRTRKEYRDQGYFSGLFRFMINDLKKRGYKHVTIGVDHEETKNKSIYKHWKFTEFIGKEREIWTDSSEHLVEYYLKDL